MLCDLFELRADGKKLPSPAGPRRGWLRLVRVNIAGELTLHADLHTSESPGAPTIVQGLHHVEVRKLDARGLLLYGLQSVPGAPITHHGEKQAWFCQPVSEAKR